VVGANYLGGNEISDLGTTTDSAVSDGENRLSTVTEIGTVTHTYDGDGRRVLKSPLHAGAESLQRVLAWGESDLLCVRCSR